MSELTLLPPNATSLERALDQVSARIEQIPIPISDLWNPETCPTEFLPWLAWSYSVDEWSSDWTETQKRRSIDNSIIVHKHKGTIGAIQDALSSIGVELSVMEWFNRVPMGQPYTFEILIDAKVAPVSQDSLGSIVRTINATKNVRSTLAKITPGVTTESNLYIGAAACVGVDTIVESGYGQDALPILMEGAAAGFVETEKSLDKLHVLLHETMSANNYW